MIYVVKFLYSFALPPGLFVVILLLLALRIRKRDRIAALLLLSATIVLYLLSTQLVGDALIRSLESRYTPPGPDRVQGDVIVVLGGGAVKDSPDVDGYGNLTGAAANRLLTAARLHFRTGLPIVFSGGQVYKDSGNEAEIARRQLIGLKVSADQIVMENRSLNTEQNAENVGQILDERHWSKPVLVTSAFHMERALLDFQAAGMQPIPYPADYWAGRQAILYANKLAPSSGGLSASGVALREYLGILALKVL
ncbi:YdcF family protein [Cohnella zeiphila]|uniref:YdcF family protein n=1 Tax=Cohnella zeiphila TaxID=2761120 RepID=A0A7X0SR05_9BACL|nr:YdcF family protein [Cohnella zeiphila]MBB6734532.1 YdcF family protein [Cohnella zeiphila]